MCGYHQGRIVWAGRGINHLSREKCAQCKSIDQSPYMSAKFFRPTGIDQNARVRLMRWSSSSMVTMSEVTDMRAYISSMSAWDVASKLGTAKASMV